MNDNFGYIDIVLLAIVAGIIILRLRNVLGKGAEDGPVRAKKSVVICSCRQKDFKRFNITGSL